MFAIMTKRCNETHLIAFPLFSNFTFFISNFILLLIFISYFGGLGHEEGNVSRTINVMLLTSQNQEREMFESSNKKTK